MRYEAPSSTKAAVSLLAKERGKAAILAGGTDLLVRMKGDFIEPDLIVDIKRIAGMREIKKTAAGFQIGAAVSGVELGDSIVKKAWPGVVEAALHSKDGSHLVPHNVLRFPADARGLLKAL